MALLKLKPSFKDYLWGGRRLVTDYNKEYDGEILAESWELSCHPDGPSFIADGPDAGMTLAAYIEREGQQVLGRNCERFQEFPILIKLIDAKDNLSIQVHPDNKYALKNEHQYGKTEMWYVTECGKDAFLYYGFNREVSREEFARRIEDNTLLEVLNAVPVHKGDIFFIESGTIHAIGKDIVIAEIQQNSNVTYRVYDYARVGKDGKQRELHVDRALAVTRRAPAAHDEEMNPHVATCDYFTVDKLNLDGRMMKSMNGYVDDSSFLSILVLDGTGSAECDGEKASFRKGDSLLITAGSGAYTISGSCQALLTTIRPKADGLRVGIDIGSAQAHIGIIDREDRVLAARDVPVETANRAAEAGEQAETADTKSGRISAEALIAQLAAQVQALLDENGWPLDSCIGVGIGCAGTINRSTGEVVYSNHLGWRHVPLTREFQKYLPVPVRAANNASCAALGENRAGAAKGKDNILMLCIGTGVGSGIVLNKEIFEGGLPGGAELGHTVLIENGRPCSCGRCGCLEAYVSLPALLADAKKLLADTKVTVANPASLLYDMCGENPEKLTPQMIFEAAAKKDALAEELLETYCGYLCDGIINAVNLFRPEAIVLGGEAAAYAQPLAGPLAERIREKNFGGCEGAVPEVLVSVLGSQAGIVGAAELIHISEAGA